MKLSAEQENTRALITDSLLLMWWGGTGQQLYLQYVHEIDKNGKNKHFMSAVLVAQQLAIELIVVLRTTLYIITVE